MMNLEMLVGKRYSDPEGQWEVIDVKGDEVTVKNVQEGNLNKDQEYIVNTEEVIYFLVKEGNMKIVVRDREAGNVIDSVESIEAGEKLIAEFEAADEADGAYSKDFYEVAIVE